MKGDIESIEFLKQDALRLQRLCELIYTLRSQLRDEAKRADMQARDIKRKQETIAELQETCSRLQWERDKLKQFVPEWRSALGIPVKEK